MDKYIFTAEITGKDGGFIALMRDVKSKYREVKWNPKSISLSDSPMFGTLDDLEDAYSKGDFHEVDNCIMSGDVPVGGLVVPCPRGETPRFGYVCGNGIDWFKVELPKSIAKAVLEYNI